jgi:hypothetical protein
MDKYKTNDTNNRRNTKENKCIKEIEIGESEVNMKSIEYRLVDY